MTDRNPSRVRESFSLFDAVDEYFFGLGQEKYIDSGSHMSKGGGRVFDISSFSQDIIKAMSGVPVGTAVYFESNTEDRKQYGFSEAKAGYSYYQDFPYLSADSYIWGNTSAAFRGTVISLGGGLLRIEGQIRPLDETFDFNNRGQSPLLEAVRAIGGALTDPGAMGRPYPIHFVGDGKIVDGVFVIGASPLALTAEPHCFSADAPILLEGGHSIPISDVSVGQRVLAFSSAKFGRDGLEAGTVTAVFSNITDVWIRLNIGLTVTPGHEFLSSSGEFRKIEEILRTDSLVVLSDGSLVGVTGRYIRYSEETSHLYEQAEGYVAATVGSLALTPIYKKGWRTYNFEVENLHTYVAGGVRVHNASVFTATGKDLTVGATFTGSNGNTYSVNADGSLTNQQTGHISPAGMFSQGKFMSAADLGPISPALQYALANAGAFSKYQYTGSGPSVRLATGELTTVGTVFYAGDGPGHRVNANGSVTNLATGNTYGVGQVRYNPDTKQFEKVESPQAAQPNAVQISPTSVPTAAQNQNSAAAAAYNSGHSSYVSSDGRVLPTTTMNGDQRNTYGDHSLSSSGGSIFNNPVVLDLDGDGISITPMSASNIFFDTAGDGKQHRTAWAGAGDGVLVRDAGDDGLITQNSEYDFTEWDSTAKTDMQALLSVFDTNRDGKLNAGDTDWALFKIVVTNADGMTALRTMAELGITAISLVSNQQEIVFSDGSKISGTTTYTKSDGTTGKAADVSLAYDPNGFVVTRKVTYNADGSTTIDNKSANADGSLANETVSTTSGDGKSTRITFDSDGDGVADRVQTDIKVVNADGSTTRTIQNHDGSGTILARNEVTVTSADLKTITISRDGNGSGTNDQVETRVTGPDGSLTVTVSDLNDNGLARSHKTVITTVDGHSRATHVDLTGTGTINTSRAETTSVAADGTRTEIVTDFAGNGTTAANKIANIVTVTSFDGSSKSIASDLDGNGTADLTTASLLVRNADGSTTTSGSRTNGNGSLRDQMVINLSADGFSKTTRADVDGNGSYDLTTISVRTLEAGTTTETTTENYANGGRHSQTVETWSADLKTRTVSVDSDGDGAFDRIDTVSVAGGNSVNTRSVYSGNGVTLLSRSAATTSADGLTQTARADSNGDGVYDATQVSTSVLNADRSSTVTVVNQNGEGTLQIGKTVTTTSADGLLMTIESYLNEQTTPYKTATDIKILNGDGSTTETVTSFAGTSHVQTGRSITTVSADRLTMTVKTFVGANASADSISTTVTNTDGSKTLTVSSYSPNGATLLRQTVTSVSADGLTAVTTTDANGDGVFDATHVSAKLLNADGTTTTMTTAFAGVETTAANKIGQSIVTSSGNGLSVTRQADSDGNGSVDAKVTDFIVLNADGSKTQTVTTYNGAGTVQTGKTVTTVSDDGLIKTQTDYLGDHTSADKVTSTATVLNNDGSTVETQSVFVGNGRLISKTVTNTSGNGLGKTVEVDLDENGVNDRVATATTNADGSITAVTSTYNAVGILTSRSTETRSGNGFASTLATDHDGDGSIDQSRASVIARNADGSTTETVSEFNANGSLRNKTVTTSSADGLMKTTQWDGAGAGSFTRTMVDVATVNADGSTRRVVSNLNANGSLHNKMTAVTAADGLKVTMTEDVNGDGTIDHTIIQTTNADGSVATSRMDGIVQAATGRSFGAGHGQYETVSATGLLRTIQYDANGDGLAERQSTDAVTRNADGSSVEIITNATLSGGTASSGNPAYMVTVTERAVITTSANGLLKTTQWDLTGTGGFGESQTDETVLNDDGSVTRTISNFNGPNLKSRYVVTDSADGQKRTTQWDTNGTGSYDETSVEYVNRNAGGTTLGGLTSTHINSDGSVGLTSLSSSEVTPDGRKISIQKDTQGVGDVSETEVISTTTGADGATTLTRSNFDGVAWTIFNQFPRNSVVTTTSADGATVQIAREVNGDGVADQTEVTTNAVDGSSTTIIVDRSANGTKIGQLETVKSADGLSQSSLRDLDGDGINDRSISYVLIRNADGSAVETLRVYRISETQTSGSVVVVAPVLIQESATTTSADGKYIVLTVDVDGNGTVDETSTTFIRIDGSTVTTVADNIAARSGVRSPGEMVWKSSIVSNVVAASTITTTSADARTRIVQSDYDGNGTYEHLELWQVKIDGSQIGTITEVNASGLVLTKATQTISADGLVTTLLRDTDMDGVNDYLDKLVIRADGSRVRTNSSGNLDTPLQRTSGVIVGTNDKVTSRIFIGGSAAELFQGSDGDDWLDGGLGNDTLVGGKGNDTYILDNLADKITENLGEGVDTVKVTFTYTLGANLENLTLIGNMAIDGTGNSLDNVLIGNSAANKLRGAAGNDTLDGGLGNDNMAGGVGNDIYVVDSSGDVVSEAANEGTDTVQASISYVLGSNVENLTLTGASATNGTGNSLNNVIIGNSGANILNGGSGNDSLSGGDGDDILIGGTGSDALNGGLGFDIASYETATSGVGVHTGSPSGNTGEAAGDTYSSIEGLRGSAFADTMIIVGDHTVMYGGGGNDVLTASGNGTQAYGEAGNDSLFGSTGADVLDGGIGDDDLHGDNGADVLEGGAGNDWLVGGSGNDTFVFRSGSGEDGIADFQVHNGTANGDVIELHDQSVTSFAALMLNAEEWSGTTYVHLDNGASITLHNVTMAQLSQSDFRFV